MYCWEDDWRELRKGAVVHLGMQQCLTRFLMPAMRFRRALWQQQGGAQVSLAANKEGIGSTKGMPSSRYEDPFRRT